MSFRSTDTHHYFLGGYCSQWAATRFNGTLPIVRASGSGALLLRPYASFAFNTAEQFMMASKAVMFNDPETLQDIMMASHPGDQKKLGRKVKNFDVDVWNQHARNVVYLGNFYKFAQDEAARNFLDSLGQRRIVEGASYDPIWGVKLDWSDMRIEDEANWAGTNWLGECIMRVRDDIAAHGKDADPWKLMRPWP